MAWDKHNGMGEAAARRTTVRAAIRHANGYSALKLSIGRGVCERAGLNPSSLVDFFWGAKGHHGWVRLQANASGKQKLTPTHHGAKASLTIVVGCLPDWMVREKRDSMLVRFSIAPDTALEIKIPKEFLSVPTGTPKTTPTRMIPDPLAIN